MHTNQPFLLECIQEGVNGERTRRQPYPWSIVVHWKPNGCNIQYHFKHLNISWSYSGFASDFRLSYEIKVSIPKTPLRNLCLLPPFEGSAMSPTALGTQKNVTQKYSRWFFMMFYSLWYVTTVSKERAARMSWWNCLNIYRKYISGI